MLLVLEVVHNHDYARSRFVGGAAVREDDFETVSAAPGGPAAGAAGEAAERMAYLNPAASVFHFLDKPLSFDDAQSAVFATPLPLIVIGSAGSGKTALTALRSSRLCPATASISIGREVHVLLRLLSVDGVEILLPVIAPSFVRKAGDSLLAWIRARGSARRASARPGSRTPRSRTPTQGARSSVSFAPVVEFGGQIVCAKDRLHALAAHPTLIVCGAHDTIIPPIHGRAAHVLIPGSRFELFEDAGHFPHAEHPERFAELLSEFIESTARPVAVTLLRPLRTHPPDPQPAVTRRRPRPARRGSAATAPGAG